MVMVTRSAFKKANESSDSKSCQNIPPWCSSSKVSEKLKPRKILSPSWQVQSSYHLRENIWEYLYEDKSKQSVNCSCKRTRKPRKQRDQHKRCGKTTVILLTFLVITLCMMVSLRITNTVPRLRQLTKLIGNEKFTSILVSGQIDLLKRFAKEGGQTVTRLYASSQYPAPPWKEKPGRKRRAFPFGARVVSGQIDLLKRFAKEGGQTVTRLYASSQYPAPPWKEKPGRKRRAFPFGARNTLRMRRAMMITSETIKEDNRRAINRGYIEGAIVTIGRNTVEWDGRVALWGIVPLWRAARPPHTVLALRKPTPADCWPFSGTYGEIIIDLPRQRRVRCISIEHVRPDTASSAPKQFVVYGVLQNDTWMKITDAEYRSSGPVKQYFPVFPKHIPMKRIALSVLSNHGNTKFTCIYRFHVYGYEEDNFELS